MRWLFEKSQANNNIVALLGVWFKGYPRCVATQFCLCRTQAGDVDVRCCARSWTCCTQEGKTSPCLLAPRDHVGQDGHELCESPRSAETNCTVCRYWCTQTCTWTYMDSEKESPDHSLSGNESPAPDFTYAAPSPVTHFVAPTPAAIHATTASFSAPATAIEFETPSPVTECETPARFTCPPAPVIEHVSVAPDDTSTSPARIDSAPVIEYIAPASP